MQASKSGTAHDATTHFGRTGTAWVSIASHYNNGEPARFVSKRSGPPHCPVGESRSGASKEDIKRGVSAAQTPRRQRPGEKQHQRQQDGIAVGSIERVRLSKQLR